MTIINIILLWFAAGCCNGIMDAIKYHNAYAHFGRFWSNDAWRDYYDGHLNWFEKIFKASFDAWHLFKYIMMACFAASLLLAFLSISTSIMALCVVMFCIMAFSVGFHITYI